MDIRRFGIGHRRPEGMPGTVNVSGQVIQSDARGVIAELAFGRNARLEAHTNPNATYLVVIEGGGFVQVGQERSRVAAGEAVAWPPNVLHGAWTEHSEMRALVVEFATTLPHVGLLVEGRAVEVGAGDRRPGAPSPAAGGLAPKPPVPQEEHVSPEGEPW
ncbi:MAG TPA: cupin domain-containing protein [Candidatus Limnocylindrales bacterium]